MKRFISVLALLLALTFSVAQSIYTKDGEYLGTRRELMHECMSGFDEEYVESDGIKVQTSTLCACLIDEVVTKLTAQQLAEIAMSDEGPDDGELMLFLMGTHFTELVNCLADKVEYNGGRVDASKIQGNMREVVIQSCAEAMLGDDSFDDTGITEKQAHNFCTCAVEKMLAKGYSYEQIMAADDQDGPVFNEVVMGCIGELGDFPEFDIGSAYNPADVRGGGASSQVTLLQFGSMGHKVKLSICGVEKYFLFDTGASDMLISQELADQLQRQGCIDADNYLGETQYVTADGKTVNAKNLVLNNVKIGDYTVDNVIVGVIDGGSLLCGLGLLQKFQKWEVTNGGKMLLLYK